MNLKALLDTLLKGNSTEDTPSTPEEIAPQAIQMDNSISEAPAPIEAQSSDDTELLQAMDYANAEKERASNLNLALRTLYGATGVKGDTEHTQNIAKNAYDKVQNIKTKSLVLEFFLRKKHVILKKK
jgi:hypothetical protein